MRSTRIFRMVEATLISLYFIQALRVLLARVLADFEQLRTSVPTGVEAYWGHGLLIVALLIPWLAPASRKRLPLALLVSSLIVGAARLGLSVQVTPFQLYVAAAIVGFGGLYSASLMRANAHTWVVGLVSGSLLEQFLRVRNSADASLNLLTDIPIGDVRLQMPWYVIHAVMLIVLVIVSLLARRASRDEPHEPASFQALGALSLGGFFALELLLLGTANMVARWTEVPHELIAPWLVLATGLPLLPGARQTMWSALSVFDERIRGWIRLFVILTLIVLGARLPGLAGALSLVIAQSVVVATLYDLPRQDDPLSEESAGPSLALAILTATLLVYGHHSLMQYDVLFRALDGADLLIFLLPAALLGLGGLRWQEGGIAQARSRLPEGSALTFVVPITVFALLASGLTPAQGSSLPGQTLRIATYNINSGYDEAGVFQLSQIARTIQTSQADVVVLQEVEAGRPYVYGIDEAFYLARELGMQHVYLAADDHTRSVAILSRWSIVTSSGVMLPTTSGESGALRAVISDEFTGRTATVIGSQLEPGDPVARYQQLGVIYGLFDAELPLILAVDLEAPPDEAAYQQLIASGFIDPDISLGVERGYTTPATNPSARYDYIFVHRLVPLTAHQVNSAASDHRLVVVELTWP